ncbi:MAG: glycosyltransferase [Pseudonocardia sp.]|nr:glycosyltransferase [Pseudonocardia sp.]
MAPSRHADVLPMPAHGKLPLPEIVEALGALPVTAVVAPGSDAALAEWTGPRPVNVRLVSFVQLRLLLPTCDLFITHAGFGSVRETLTPPEYPPSRCPSGRTSRRTRSGWPTSAPVSRRAGTKWIRRRSPRPVAGSWRTLRTGRPFAASNARFSACPVSTSWWPTSMHWLGHLVGTPRGGPVEDADAVLAGARTPSVAYMRDQTGRR